MTKKRKVLAIIDGKSVFYRGFYAMPYLSNKDGIPTGGVYGFAVLALEIIKKLKPDYVCVAWDKQKTNIRSRVKLYPQYKANRKPAPKEFYEQIPVLHELLEAFNWPLLELDDYEADDIMGSLAVQAKEQDIETLLITSDLDVLQLINSHVEAYTLKKGLSNVERLDPKAFRSKYGIEEHQFVDLKALKGDSSDNIPGVPGIGEKTALDLLKRFQNLDGIYDNLELIKNTTRKKLEDGKELAYLSKKLATIWLDAPVELDLPEMDVKKLDKAALRELMIKLEFRSLLRQLPEGMISKEESSGDHYFFHGGSNTLISSEEDLDKIQLDGDILYIHTRCAGAHGRFPKILIIASDPKNVFTVDLTKIDQKVIIKKLKVLGDEKIGKVGYDLKSDIKAIIGLGGDLLSVSHDVLIGAFLLNSLRREVSLTDLATNELNFEGESFEDMSEQDLISRAAEVISVISKLYEKQKEDLKRFPKIAKLAREIEWPVIATLARMEYRGIKLDTKKLRDLNEKLEDSISDLQQEIFGIADFEFNISSPSQLAELLFGKLGITTDGIKKGKTGFSTAASELGKLKGQHPIIDLILKYRELTKLKNTYVDTLPNQTDENGYIHTTYNLATAQTGRLSSTDPNLQNIPVRSELGNKIREAFIPSKGKVFVSADYSQFELRLAAYLSGDEELIKLFNDGLDVHTETAAEVYGVSPGSVTKEQRRNAKVINFGILYGMSPHGLSVATGMSQSQSKDFIDRYFNLRKPILDYMNKLKQQAKEQGFVETLFGRRRPTPDVKSSNFLVRSAAERAAINMPIQGTEADLMKMAMVKIENCLGKDCELLLQVHDSLLVQCPKDKAKETSQIMKQCMESIYSLPIKLEVDVKIGLSWGEI